jgi:hypothetical protein
LRYENGILAVGANAQLGHTNPGAVYVFEQDATGKFVRRAKLVSDNGANERFGVDISMAGFGNVMVIGSPNESFDATGAAYIFKRTSAGVWRRHQKLVAAETLPRDAFGTAVAIDNGMILVGAPGAHDDGNDFTLGGAAYGFIPGAGLWVESFQLRPRPGDVEIVHRFGQHIVMFGKHIGIAAEDLDIPEGDVPTGTFVFTYTREQLSVVPRGIALHGTLHGAESMSVALANNWLLVGGPCQREGFCEGSAAVFDVLRFR